MKSQTLKRYLAFLLLVASFALSAASAISQERKVASETNGCNCANGSLVGDSVGTRFNLGPGPIVKVVGPPTELVGAGPILGAAGPSPRWNIDFGANTIRIDFLQQVATYGMGSYFTFSSLDPQLAGCPPPFISSITVTTNKPTVPFNVVTAATFGPHTVTVQIAPGGGNLDWLPGEFILVKLNFACETPNPEPNPIDPCCPPWNQTMLKNMVFYQGTTISAPYTLHFQPTTAFKNQMQGYIDYLHFFGFNAITIDWSLYDHGTGTIPITGLGTIVPGSAAQTTWNSPGSGNPFVSPVGFFPGSPMQVGSWYRVHTVIHLGPGQVFFSEKCAINDIFVRVQVMNAKTNGAPVLEFSDGKQVIKSIPIRENKERQ